MTPREVGGDLTPRLSKAAGDVADARKQLDIALERRDELIGEAEEAGMSQGAIARAVGLSQPHVLRVCAAAATKRLLP